MTGLGEASPADPWVAVRGRVQMEITSFREIISELDRRMKKHQAHRARLDEAKDSFFERRQAYLLRQKELDKARADLNAWKGPAEQINRILTAEADMRVRF